MRTAILLTITCLMLAGCQPSAPTTAEAPVDPAANSQPASGGDGGVTQVTPTPVPNAPVTGTESLQGGGSAVGTIAKDRAKDAANKASGSSLGSVPDSE